MFKALLYGLFCTLGMGITLDRKLSATLYGLTVNHTVDYVRAQQLQLEAYLTVPVTSFWQKTAKDSASSNECKHTIRQMQRIHDSFETLVVYPMSQIDIRGQAVLVKMEDALQLEDDLVELNTVLETLKTSVNALTILPVVGGAMSTLKTGLTTLQAGAVKNMKQGIRSFNRAVVDKTKPTTKELLEKNAALAEKLVIAKFIVYEYVIKPVLVVDEYCPGVTRNTSCHPMVTSQLTTIADSMDQFVGRVMDIANFYETLDETLEMVSKVIDDTEYKDVMHFFGTVADKLDPFTKFLDKTIALKLSIGQVCLDVPCGVKTCKKKILGKTVKYPCGVNLCQECTPSAKIDYSFKVKDIINGIGALTSLFMDALKSMLPPLPEINIPGFPTLPNLPLFEIPDVDISLDVQSLGLVCMSEFSVAVVNGMPSGIDMGTCFDRIPSIHC
jgi:hypothetical protein